MNPRIKWLMATSRRAKASGALRFVGDASGFSLIELLVVMAVAAVLIGLTFSGFSQVRQKMQSMACQTNLRTISTALHAYVADHDGKLIPAATYVYEGKGGSWYSPDKSVGGHWYTQLDPYVNPGIDTERSMKADKRDVWPLATRAKYAKWQLCPAKNPKLLGNADDYKVVGYGWNTKGFGITTRETAEGQQDPSATGGENSRMSQVEKPGATIIIGDSKDADDSSLAYQNQYLYEGLSSTRPSRHSGGGNYLFLDGHIEWITPEKLNERIKAPEWVFRKRKE